MLWYVLQSIDVSASPKTVSACGASSTLSTTAYFKLFTKNEDNTTSASTNTSETVTASASYSENKSYTSVSGNKIIFDKNAINYPTTSKADARDSIVTGSYTYSGVNKTNTVTVTQSENNVGGWVWISDTTTSIAISPTTLSFGSCEQTIDYSVTRYYDSYYEKYDSCSVKMDSKTDNNNMAVTPSEATADGSFSATTTNVSIGTNTGAYRSGTLTVKYDGHSDTSSLEQAASQQGRYYGAAYGHSYDFYTTVDNSTISCDGGSATFKSYYYSYYKKDYVDKDHCGTEIGTGTAEYPNTSDVTTSSVWTTNVGEITNGSLSIGSTTSDRTITVQASYGDYSHTNYAYQKDCKPALTNNCASVEVQGRDWTVTLPYAATSDLTYTFHAVNGFEESGNDLSGLDWTQTVDVAKGSKTGRARSSQYQFATDDSTFSSVSPSEDDTYNYSDCSITINSDWNDGDSGDDTGTTNCMSYMIGNTTSKSVTIRIYTLNGDYDNSVTLHEDSITDPYEICDLTDGTKIIVSITSGDGELNMTSFNFKNGEQKVIEVSEVTPVVTEFQ